MSLIKKYVHQPRLGGYGFFWPYRSKLLRSYRCEYWLAPVFIRVGKKLNVPHNSIYSLYPFTKKGFLLRLSLPRFQARLTVLLRLSVPVKCSKIIDTAVGPADSSADTQSWQHFHAIRRRFTRCPSSVDFSRKNLSCGWYRKQNRPFLRCFIQHPNRFEVSTCTISPVSGWRTNITNPQKRTIPFFQIGPDFLTKISILPLKTWLK